MIMEQQSGRNVGSLLHGDLTERIPGAFSQVPHELGHGFAESVYGASLAILLTEAGLCVEREVPIAVHFHGIPVGSFRADLVVESKVVLELKALKQIEPPFEAQLLNYLRATELEVGLLAA